MSLEKRVEELEKEVALLKAQIQTTLLDIQEHLANQAYPALRGDEPGPSSTPSRNGRKPQPEWEPEEADHTQMKSPLRQVRISDDDLPIDPDPPTQPAVVRAKKIPVATPEPMPAPRPSAPRQPAAPAHPQNSQRQAPAPQRPAAQSNGRAASKPQAAPQPKPQPTAPKAAPPAAAAPRPTQKTPAPAKAALQPPARKRSTAEHERVEEQNTLVLRLIAGIQNAGAGITKKRTPYG
jgi:translation initiation factor IF-2